MSECDSRSPGANPSAATRRQFLQKLGLAATCAGAAVVSAGALGALKKESAAKSDAGTGAGSFPTKDYDWTRHQWAFGVDAGKCIGCLRCVMGSEIRDIRVAQAPRNAGHHRVLAQARPDRLERVHQVAGLLRRETGPGLVAGDAGLTMAT